MQVDQHTAGLSPAPRADASPGARAGSPEQRVHAALIATHARVLAASAARAHRVCVVMDCGPAPQGRANPHHWLQTSATHQHGQTDFEGADLIRRLASLPDDWVCLPVIYGAGFDHRPELLARIGRHHRLLGNDPDTLSLMSDPTSFADIATHLGMPHSPISDSLPADATGWLARHVDDEFDRHTQPARSCGPERMGRYFQRVMPGAAMSAMFVADGRTAQVLSFVGCLHEGHARVGAISGSCVPVRVAGAIKGALNRLASEFGLTGLNRLDFTLADERWWATRLVARPSDEVALIDEILPHAALAMHVDAIEGRLPPPIKHSAVVGMRRVLAPRPMLIDRKPFPDWVLDPPAPGQVVDRGETLCTVLASANTHDEVRATLMLRSQGLSRPQPKMSM